MLLFDDKCCVSICLKNTNKYVRQAVENLRNDFKRISNFGLTPKIVSEETEYCIVIEENTTSDCQPIKNEGFSIKTDGNKIRIFADGYLGTLWGIYTFCEKHLGVDPRKERMLSSFPKC